MSRFQAAYIMLRQPEKHLDGLFLLFKRADFVHFGGVGAMRIVAQVEPDVHQCPCGRGGDDVLPHAQDLRVVVFYCAAHAG